jgi:hypothetical protein
MGENPGGRTLGENPGENPGTDGTFFGLTHVLTVGPCCLSIPSHLDDLDAACPEGDGMMLI